MDKLKLVYDFCEQRKNGCDKNLDTIGMDKFLDPIFQTNMGASNAYWAVQKVIEGIWEDEKETTE